MSFYPSLENIYLLKDSNRNTRKRCEICSELKMKALEDVIVIVIEYISHLFLVLLLLTDGFYLLITDMSARYRLVQTYRLQNHSYIFGCISYWRTAGNDYQIITKLAAQKMKFSIKDFFSKCDQTRSFLRIWSHLLKKSLMENFIFCAVTTNQVHYTRINSYMWNKQKDSVYQILT